MPKHIRLHGIDHFDSSSASNAAARLFSLFLRMKNFAAKIRSWMGVLACLLPTRRAFDKKKRFLVIRKIAEAQKPFSEINIIVNWFDELKRRVPKNKS